MEEDELESILNKLEPPDSRYGAKARTADAAWAKLQQSQSNKNQRKSLFSVFSNAPAARNFAVACSLILAVGGVLSYSVTQYSRSGGGATEEANLINNAQITQYPASVRTATIRMVINGIKVQELNFTPPENFDTLTNFKTAVFHPQGGGGTYRHAPATIMANKRPGQWHFNAEFEIEGIGSSRANHSDGNELLAFLPNIKEETCLKLNKDLGISGPIKATENYAPAYSKNIISNYTWPPRERVLGDRKTPGLRGQPFGCFQNNDGTYVYFHTLVER
ncbi:MAG: hypothetical protein R3E13_04565 [Alphaproteobacteria bacterium]